MSYGEGCPCRAEWRFVVFADDKVISQNRKDIFFTNDNVFYKNENVFYKNENVFYTNDNDNVADRAS
jgi:hypothetical protein